MAEEKQRPYKGLQMDVSHVDQPKDTYSYALNAVSESLEGDTNKLSFEQSNEVAVSLPFGYSLLKAVYIGKNTFCVFASANVYISRAEGYYDSSIIGTLNLDSKVFKTFVDHPGLNFQLEYPIEAVFRLRRGCEITVYFTDDYNVPRYFNFNSVEDFKTLGEWDTNKFSLIKTYNKIPKYKKIDVIQGGTLPAGSYNFALQYLDSDLNPTEWLNVSDTIIIFHDNEKEMSYESVRGSTNKVTAYQAFGPTTKSIRLSLSNLDDSYTFYRVAIIEANSGTGLVTTVSYSQELSTKQTLYTYTGSNAASKGTEQEIALFQIDIKKASSILQLENTLILGNTKGLSVNLCKLQKYASKIKPNFSTREIVLNTTKSDTNQKNPEIHMFTGENEDNSVGYMPGEIYSFGIVYVFAGGLTSPVYHIPGVASTDANTLMSKDNVLTTTFYQDNEICDGELGYWGVDYLGNSLAGINVRHHRFPSRPELLENVDVQEDFGIKKTTLAGGTYTYELYLTETILLLEDPVLTSTLYKVTYTLNGEFITHTGTLDLTTYDADNLTYNFRILIATSQYSFSNPKAFETDSNGDRTPGAGLKFSFDITQTIDPSKTLATNIFTLKDTGVGTFNNSLSEVNYKVTYTIDGITKISTGNISLLNYNTSTFPNFQILIDSSTRPIVLVSIEELVLNTAGTDYVPVAPSTNSGIIYGTTIVSENILIEGEVNTSQIMGINFCNIEVPTKVEIGEEIVGYYIVQNKRDEENKTVLDTGVIIPITDNPADNFQGVGFLSPDAKDITNDSDFTASKLTPVAANRYALFHPENAFLKKEYTTAEIEYIGSYSVINFSVQENTDIQDAQPGTSYNADRHKKRERDTDGFTLQTLSRKGEAKGFNYSFNLGQGVVPAGRIGMKEFISDVEDISYLNTLYSFSKTENNNVIEVFNLSTDNRFAVVSCNSDMPDYATPVSGPAPNTIQEPFIKNSFFKHVVVLKRPLSDPYANYRVLPYYKASKNIQSVTETETTIFSGDSYISPVTITSSIFSDVRNRKRTSKSGLFKVIIGAVIVALAVVAAPLTGGASLIGGAALLGTGAVATAIAITAIGLGVTLAATGLKVEKMRQVYELLYEEGLRNVVHDFITKKFFDPNPIDDSIQWFSDVIENIYLESSVNMNWRSGTSGQIPDFADSPINHGIEFYNDRLIDKLTVLDPERDTGRLYQGFCNAELYEINLDYLRRELQKPFFHLPIEYDCCTDCPEEFKNRFVWSEQSFQEELTDNYRSFLPLSYKDIQGESGEITGLHTIQENLYIHTEDALWNVPKEYQERVTDQIISFIGTGNLFSIPPRKIIDAINGNNGGSQNQRGSIKTPYGILFVSENEKGIYLFNGNELKPLHSQGISNWLKNNLNLNMVDLFQEKSQLEYPLKDNPYSVYGTGFVLGFDNRRQKAFITKKDFKVTNQLILDATDLYLGFEGDNVFFLSDLQGAIDALNLSQTYKYKIKGAKGSEIFLVRDAIVGGNYVVQTYTIQADPIVLDMINTSWTLSYDLRRQEWGSFMSFHASAYLTSGDEFYSYDSHFKSVWKHNIKGKFNSFYGVNYNTIIEYVKINSGETKVLNSLRLYTEAKKYDFTLEEYYTIENKTFNKAVFYNSKQCSGLLTLIPKANEEDNWFSSNSQIVNVGDILIDKNEEDWSINDIRDIRIDYSKPIWIKSKDLLDSVPFVDKVLNEDTLDFNKDWQQMESLRDKYLVVRLIFDSFDDINILLNYSDSNENISES
jgi:hypothetical protein